ncbi:hypothetical protein GCM10023082_23540 [Streptomyces tremellae]|uniref:Uncharacterized protein n=1 Tax=Streptomyces tremellae TaxID=1124239 RepID=A0ABP7EX31_9ACTN
MHLHPERAEAVVHQLLPRQVHHRRAEVSVGRAEAVAGEVPGAGAHPGALEPLDPGRRVPCHQRATLAEGADTVRGKRVDRGVDGGRQVPADAGRHQREADLARGLAGALRVVEPAEGVVARHRRTAVVLQAVDVATLLVDGEQHMLAQTVRARRQLAHPGGRHDVPAEQDGAAETFGCRCAARTGFGVQHLQDPALRLPVRERRAAGVVVPPFPLGQRRLDPLPDVVRHDPR